MRFSIVFCDGSRIEDDAVDAVDRALIGSLLQAKERGLTHLTVGVAGGRVLTVGDIRSITTGINVEARP